MAHELVSHCASECSWCTEAATDTDESGDPACKKHSSDVLAEMYCREPKCYGLVTSGRASQRAGLCAACKHRQSARESSARHRRSSRLTSVRPVGTELVAPRQSSE